MIGALLPVMVTVTVAVPLTAPHVAMIVAEPAVAGAVYNPEASIEPMLSKVFDQVKSGCWLRASTN